MLKNTLFPNLTAFSFISIVIYLCTLVFLAQVFVDGVQIPGAFLQVSSHFRN